METAPLRSRLIVLCGPAGVGKSVLSAALLDAAHEAFNQAKSRDQWAARPILFEPVDLGSTEGDAARKTITDAAEAGSFRQLVAKLFGTEISGELPPRAFSWLLRHGLNTWMLDGLDEFFRRQTDFFRHIEGALETSGSRALILMSTRDSLFASSDALRGFLEKRLDAAPEQTEIYELDRWDAAARRGYIEAVLTAEQGEAGRPQIDAIATRIEARNDLAELSDLPFYCAELVRAIRLGDEKALKSEFALLQFALDAMIRREVADKKVMRLDDFVSVYDREEVVAELGATATNPAALEAAIDARGKQELEFALGLAAFLYRFAEERPLEQLEAAEWLDMIPSLVAPGMELEAERRLEAALSHFPLFARGDEEGEVRFVHLLIAEYLASTYALRLIQIDPRSPNNWRMALGSRRDWEQTVFFRRLVAELRADAGLRSEAEKIQASGALPDAKTKRLGALLAAV